VCPAVFAVEYTRVRLKCDGTRAETRFRLSTKRTSPFKSAGASVHSSTGSRGVRISGSNAGYTMFRGSKKGTGYQLHSPVSPSLPLPCVAVCHHISTGFYNKSWGFPLYRVIHKSLRDFRNRLPSTKTDTAERSISIGRESLQVILVLGALAFDKFRGYFFRVPPCPPYAPSVPPCSLVLGPSIGTPTPLCTLT
jgi:hypothetical protein